MGTYNKHMDLEAGSYFIDITPWNNNGTGVYTLRTDFAAAGNNEVRPNNTRANAQVLTPGQTAVIGFISHQNRNGMYRVDLRQPGRLAVHVSRNDNGGMRAMGIAWFDAEGKQVRQRGHNGGTYNQQMDLEAGTYFIEITPWSNTDSGTYNLRVEFTQRATQTPATRR
jgi:hypothetical protein